MRLNGRTIAWWLWWVLAFGIAGLLLFPVNSRLIRFAEVGGLLAVWLGLLALLWRKRAARWTMLAFTFLAGAVAVLPGKESANVEKLCADYLASLRRYEGVRYIWGGENFLGLDCSGLCRRAMIDALALRGIRDTNPALLRAAVRLWWQDCTAKSLGLGQDTVPVLKTPSLNRLDPQTILPGDLAVTETGVHILAHLGGGEWIEADPILMRVIRERAPGENAWFASPMRIVRWRWLAAP